MTCAVCAVNPCANTLGGHDPQVSLSYTQDHISRMIFFLFFLRPELKVFLCTSFGNAHKYPGLLMFFDENGRAEIWSPLVRLCERRLELVGTLRRLHAVVRWTCQATLLTALCVFSGGIRQFPESPPTLCKFLKPLFYNKTAAEQIHTCIFLQLYILIFFHFLPFSFPEDTAQFSVLAEIERRRRRKSGEGFQTCSSWRMERESMLL